MSFEIEWFYKERKVRNSYKFYPVYVLKTVTEKYPEIISTFTKKELVSLGKLITHVLQETEKERPNE